LNFNIQKVIEDLQIAIGILNKEGTDYTFPHRSIQEYFAANYICSLSESNKKIIINKIIKSIENNWIYPYENSHFLTLLLEQDYISFLNYLVLPILKKLNKRAKNYNIKGDLNVKYDIACKIYMITYYLLNRSLYMELIHKDFNVDNGPGVIIFPENNIFPLPSDKKLSLETERIENSFNVIIEKSDKWIESLEIKIDEQEKSDSEIISII
ncbi:MAG: hypothetical protein HQ541_16080, partial [Mariniphaga sp.]|nr:hypothetical protein [Mariniphaga sp.]